MRMADVLPKPRHGNLRILLAPYKGIVRVPKQGYLRRVSLLQNIEQRGRTDKIAVGFEQHSNILRAGIVAELTQGFCHSRNDFIRRSHDLVSHDPYVRGSQLRSQVDKPPAVGHLLFVLRRVRIVHVSRGINAGNTQATGGDVFLRLFDAARAKLRTCRQVHVAHQASQFHAGEAMLLGKIEDPVPTPRRTTKRGDEIGSFFGAGMAKEPTLVVAVTAPTPARNLRREKLDGIESSAWSVERRPCC